MQQTAPSPSPTAERLGASTLAYNLALLGLLVMLLAVGAAYLVDRLGRANGPGDPALDDGDPIVQTIAGRELSIPTNWFRFGEQIRDGFTDQIDLRVTMATETAISPVHVTLLPRSRARTSASLLDGVYLHQFTDTTLGGISGLVGKPMRPSNGYMGESIWYDAISPNPFVAKCMAGIDGAAAQCVRTVYLPSGIAAVYTFDATLLQSWRRFDADMERWLTAVGAW